jgi:protein phosphatase
MSNPEDDDTLVLAPPEQFADTFFASPNADLPIEFGAASHVGLVRSRNEDHFAVVRFRRDFEIMLASLASEELAAPQSFSHTMIVADGMGGMKAGELASRLALQTMLELAGQASSWVMMLADPNAQQIRSRVEAYIHRIQRALLDHGDSHPSTSGMGTTWTSAHLLGKQVIIVHIGDSRAYLFRQGELQQITRDETLAQNLIDSGLAPNLAKRFGHVLVNSLGGTKEDVTARIFYLEIEPGDRLLLCSDGLSDMVTDAEIAVELSKTSTAQGACDALIQRALENGGRDNITVVLASAQNSEAGQL